MRIASQLSREMIPAKQCFLLLAIYVLSGCTNTHSLPKLLPISADRYPPASRRLGEEGRVLVEFNLDKHGRALAPRVIRSEASARLDTAALRVIENLPIDPTDHHKPMPSDLFRVTVLFCLTAGHCAELVPFANTEPVRVTATKPPEPNIIFE